VRDIGLAGLTPPLPLVRAIAAEVPLPLRIMVRENSSFWTDATDLVRLCRAAATFADLGVDGLVVGFATSGQLMVDELRDVLNAAGSVPATFHAAFDSLRDPLRAIDTLAAIPQIDRILTTGASDRKEPGRVVGVPLLFYDRRERCKRLSEYAARAGSRLTILAGGGVDEDMLCEIARTRCVREVHVGRAAREGGQESPVTAARVRRLRDILDGSA